MNELWERRARALLDEERSAASSLHRSLRRATDTYEDARKQLDQRRKDLDAMKDDPIVLVRRGPGPKPTVYHAVGGSCGWRPLPPGREPLFLSEAKKAHLGPCSAQSCRREFRQMTSA